MTIVATGLADVERLYRGAIGDAYLERNRAPIETRAPFFRRVGLTTSPASVLEVGACIGANLGFLRSVLPAARMVGVDINRAALDTLRARSEEEGARLQALEASAGALPFADRSFDLVISAGLTMHTPPDGTCAVFGELGRVAARHVLLCEYDATHEHSIPWRGTEGMLWKRPFALTFWSRNPEFAPLEHGTLSKDDGFEGGSAFALFRRRDAEGRRH